MDKIENFNAISPSPNTFRSQDEHGNSFFEITKELIFHFKRREFNKIIDSVSNLFPDFWKDNYKLCVNIRKLEYFELIIKGLYSEALELYLNFIVPYIFAKPEEYSDKHCIFIFLSNNPVLINSCEFFNCSRTYFELLLKKVKTCLIASLKSMNVDTLIDIAFEVEDFLISSQTFKIKNDPSIVFKIPTQSQETNTTSITCIKEKILEILNRDAERNDLYSLMISSSKEYNNQTPTPPNDHHTSKFGVTPDSRVNQDGIKSDEDSNFKRPLKKINAKKSIADPISVPKQLNATANDCDSNNTQTHPVNSKIIIDLIDGRVKQSFPNSHSDEKIFDDSIKNYYSSCRYEKIHHKPKTKNNKFITLFKFEIITRETIHKILIRKFKKYLKRKFLSMAKTGNNLIFNDYPFLKRFTSNYIMPPISLSVNDKLLYFRSFNFSFIYWFFSNPGVQETFPMFIDSSLNELVDEFDKKLKGRTNNQKQIESENFHIRCYILEFCNLFSPKVNPPFQYLKAAIEEKMEFKTLCREKKYNKEKQEDYYGKRLQERDKEDLKKISNVEKNFNPRDKIEEIFTQHTHNNSSNSLDYLKCYFQN